MEMPDSQRYHWLYLINDLEDIVDFLGLKVFNYDNSSIFACSKNTQFAFVEKPLLKIIIFQNYKHLCLIHS